MREHTVAQSDTLEDGDRLLVELQGREVCVFKVDGEIYAYLNWCPHMAGPCCEGKLTGKQEATYDREALELKREWTAENRVINCPWHGWQFDLETGECLSRSGNILPSYPVTEEDGEIIVSL